MYDSVDVHMCVYSICMVQSLYTLCYLAVTMLVNGCHISICIVLA